MEMAITFPGGKRVDATFRDFTVNTDQPTMAGGANSAPSPFEYFLSSIGTCVGIYVLSFCAQRNIPTDDIVIRQNSIVDKNTRMFDRIEFDIDLPEDFPEQYRDAVIRSAEQCAVKKHLADPPDVVIRTNK